MKGRGTACEEFGKRAPAVDYDGTLERRLAGGKAAVEQERLALLRAVAARYTGG